MTIHLTSDWSAIEAEIDRVMILPVGKTAALLDAVQDAALATVVADVHVITGSLKSSVRGESRLDVATRRWEGTITAGGPSMGVHDPVDYAIYEKRRGGLHDFFGALPGLHVAYVEAVKSGLSS